MKQQNDVICKLKSQAIRRMSNSCRQNTWLQHNLTVKFVRGAALRCASHKYYEKFFLTLLAKREDRKYGNPKSTDE